MVVAKDCMVWYGDVVKVVKKSNKNTCWMNECTLFIAHSSQSSVPQRRLNFE